MYFVGELKDKNLTLNIVGKLKSRGINSQDQFDPVKNTYSIWVYDQDDLIQAQDYYRTAMGFPKEFEIPEQWKLISKIPIGFFTRFLIVFSVLVYLTRYLPELSWITQSFFFSEKTGVPLFKEILEGEIWRLWTPIFLHFGFIHLLFNVLWLKDLGKLLEHFQGKLFLFLIIILCALTSNIAQYLMSGPRFGGLSGVVYSLLGFIWMAKIFHPKIPYELPKSDVVMMIVWFLLCGIGLITNVANIAHGIGLSSGMLIGIFWGIYKEKQIPYLKFSKYFLLSLAFSGAIILWEMR